MSFIFILFVIPEIIYFSLVVEDYSRRLTVCSIAKALSNKKKKIKKDASNGNVNGLIKPDNIRKRERRCNYCRVYALRAGARYFRWILSASRQTSPLGSTLVHSSGSPPPIAL